ncbi:MAG: Fic family protein [Acidimicrobiales bacterium]
MPEPGAKVTVDWNGRPVEAWVPAPLAARDLGLAATTAQRAESANAAVRRAGELVAAGWEPVARLLLRAEGVASSNIEGLRAPLVDVVAAELDPGGSDYVAAWVADNLAAVAESLERIATRGLTLGDLHRWHRRLMVHGGLGRRTVEGFRSAPGWIGGSSPVDAVYVPPPAGLVSDLMADLVAFANRDDVDPVTQAAVAHAQFETIQPYGYGNGRVGRLLIGWILARRLPTGGPPPPVSVLMVQDPGGHLSGLRQFRTGHLDAWVARFAEMVRRSGDVTVALTEQVSDLGDAWRARLAGLRADATARALLELLAARPVVNAALAAEFAEVSQRSARTALETLAEVGIVAPLGDRAQALGPPHLRWVAPEIVHALASLPRSVPPPPFSGHQSSLGDVR